VEVAGGERGEVIGPSAELAGFVRVGEELCVALRITESPAKLCVIVRDKVFSICVRIRGRAGGARAFSFPFLVGGGSEPRAGAEAWGRALGGAGVHGLSHHVTGP